MRGPIRHSARNSPGTSGSGRLISSADVLSSARRCRISVVRARAWKCRTRPAAGARRLPPSPGARFLSVPDRGPHLRILSASAGRSSPCRASARTRRAAARMRIWCCGRPRTYLRLRSWDAASPADNWPPARRGFRGETFPDRTWQRFRGCWIDLSHRMAEFNISLAHAVGLRDMIGLRRAGVTDAATIEKQEETDMRLKLLSPGEMNADQKQTYDESIAGKRGAPPPPMMAWLKSPEMARPATRLGAVLRFDTIFPAKLSEIAILVTARHWTSHYEWY